MKATTWTLALIIAGLFTACEDVIELEVPEGEPLIVINGRITDSDSTGIVLMATAPYFSNTALPKISGANVRLFENNELVGELKEDSAGYYRLDYRGVVGNVYHIRVEVPEGNPWLPGGVWQSLGEELRRIPEIDSVFSQYRENRPPFLDGIYPYFMFNDPVGEGDRYRLRLWRNDSLLTRPQELTTYEDRFWDGRSFDNIDLPAPQISGTPFPAGTAFRIEKSSISKRYFDYLELLFQQTVQVGSTFDPPPAPLLGNIKCVSDPNRISMGYFNASAIRIADLELKE